jgi:hypothetical protein
MEDRVEFRREQRPTLIRGLGFLGIAAIFFLLWWDATYGTVTYGTRFFPPSRKEGSHIIVALVGLVLGLWDLAKLRDTSVKVAVDRDGITDFREMAGPIPWADVERIEHVIIRKARGFRKPSGLQLVLRAGSQARLRHQKTPEVTIWEMGLDGGSPGLRQAVARLAPQVPRNWTDAQI